MNYDRDEEELDDRDEDELDDRDEDELDDRDEDRGSKRIPPKYLFYLTKKRTGVEQSGANKRMIND